jgi:hypothetical protein
MPCGSVRPGSPHTGHVLLSLVVHMTSACTFFAAPTQARNGVNDLSFN